MISRRFFPASCFSCFSFFLGWAESFCLLFFLIFHLLHLMLPLCCGDSCCLFVAAIYGLAALRLMEWDG